MVSKSKFRKSQGEEGSDAIANLAVKLTEMKKQIQTERAVSVGEKLQNNSKNIQSYVSHLKDLAASRADSTATTSNSSGDLLSLRMKYPLCKVSGHVQGFEDRDGDNSEDVVCSMTAKLPRVERICPYTTWIFLDRNQRMADDQSVLGRRRIYYDQHGSETLICSDSEEDLLQLEGEKREYSEAEDRLMRVAFLEHGAGDEVVDLLTQFVGGSSQEIQEHCTMLMEKDQQMETQKKTSKEEKSEDNISLDQSLTAALDSFENLFCRRCLVFDCRLHGCSQALTYPNEKQFYQCDTEEDRKPCGDQCYLQLKRSESEVGMPDAQNAPCQEERQGEAATLVRSSSQDATLVAQVCEADRSCENELEKSTFGLVHAIDCPQSVTVDQTEKDPSDKEKDSVELLLRQTCKSVGKASHGWSNWKPLEKDLYLKGLEIFGRNSCFIARNLLPGLRTCKEVSHYMYGDGAGTSRGSSAMLNSYYEDVERADMDPKEADMPAKSRICRKRGRVRKVKSSWKSAGHPSLWRRIADGKDEPYKQYNPCGCQPTCGKQCPCLQSGTCCEKYCGCAKSCKNRFRGCHCAKSQCKSRQCPCFAARRECDPDVCRNCWISCGDGSLGEPSRRGDSQCGNMKLLLRQQQRILLSKSEVAGWGAFIQNPVNKNDYLGEYTGELISHQEADKRGKIYDRANSSFLFDLNNKYVLDAYRKGDKLKFANHSSNPNCYAKIMLVAGDHRVGIYANEHLQSGEEIFYDYRYGPDEAPSWARKPETSKRDCSPLPHGRAKKHQSG